jgi:hypothetical protein
MDILNCSPLKNKFWAERIYDRNKSGYLELVNVK